MMKEQGTYKNIQKWVKNKYGYIPKTCWIAQVKELSGLIVKKAWNRKDENVRQVPCPVQKIEHIKEALKYYEMLK